MDKIGTLAVPSMIMIILIYGIRSGSKVYEDFCEGVIKGIGTVKGIFPALFAVFIAVGVLRSSGILDVLLSFLKPLGNAIGIPTDIIPFALLRPVSGSASLAMAKDIFESTGVDSEVSKIASVMMGSTETTFYTTAVYFSATGTKNIRHSLKCGLIADLISFVVAIIVCRFYYA